MSKLGKSWLEILSEFFVNIAAGWFGIIFIEPQIAPIRDITDVLALTFKGIFGIVSLVLAKILREETRK